MEDTCPDGESGLPRGNVLLQSAARGGGDLRVAPEVHSIGTGHGVGWGK